MKLWKFMVDEKGMEIPGGYIASIVFVVLAPSEKRARELAKERFRKQLGPDLDAEGRDADADWLDKVRGIEVDQGIEGVVGAAWVG